MDIVDRLDLSALSGTYRGRGSEADHPALLLSLLVYGYATGMYSSRRIQQATFDSVAFRYIAADQHPDHDTVSTFRQNRRSTSKRWHNGKPANNRPEIKCHALPHTAAGRTDGPRSNHLTDAESRILPQSGGGFAQGYNAQIAVDVDSLLIVGRDVVQAANDRQQLKPMLE